MQKNRCSACATEWNKLKKRQSCITEERFHRTQEHRFGACCLICFDWYCINCCATILHVCARCLRMHVYVCMLWARSINTVIYCDLLVQVNILMRIVRVIKNNTVSSWKLPILVSKGIWRGCLYITLQWCMICKKKLNRILSPYLSVWLWFEKETTLSSLGNGFSCSLLCQLSSAVGLQSK